MSTYTQNSLPKLKILIFGAGAIGTYIGGSLQLAGQQVVFIERPEISKALAKSGLTITHHDTSRHIDHPVFADTIEDALHLGPYDLSICAIKSYDTASLVNELTPYAIALPPLISFQNGVENESAFAKILGEDRVIAGTVTTAIGRKGAGDIVVEKLRGIGIERDHLLSPTITAILNAAGLNANMVNGAQDMKWSKMLTNLLANASSAILNMPPSQIYANRKLFALEIRQFMEAVRVMKAQNLKVVSLPGTPVRLLTWVITTLPLWISQPVLKNALGKGRGAKMPSFHIDLYLGRGKSEVDYLNGAVVRFGEKCGIPTPVNKHLTKILLALTDGTTPKEKYAGKPDVLLEGL
ncbi:MAG TPA: ketopantoate reductase family protein [Anaerolineaceae bacterium]